MLDLLGQVVGMARILENGVFPGMEEEAGGHLPPRGSGHMNDGTLLVTDPPDLNFTLLDTLHATHGLHAFAAKCPPPLAAWAIREYSDVGDQIVDPMAGSGTTLVEGRLAGRSVYGSDLDPLATLLCQVKATPLSLQRLERDSMALLDVIDEECAEWDRLCQQGMNGAAANDSLHLVIPTIPNGDYWFLWEVTAKLAIVKRTIDNARTNRSIRNLFYAAFSSLIVARTSVANARDLVHSRHHHIDHAETPNIPRLLRQRLGRMQRQLGDFVDGLPDGWFHHGTVVHRGDARKLRIRSSTADLVFTSPPYCNALDYPRAHQLAIAWLGDVLGTDIESYRMLARTYIGTDRASKALPFDGDCIPVDSPTAKRVIREVASTDRVRAAVVQRYFQDMTHVLAEIGRVLKPERHAVLVVCPSNIRRISIPSHQVFVEIGERLHLLCGHQLRAVATHERVIDDRKRLLPYMDHTTLAHRMRTEYVIVFRKERAL